MTGETGNGGLRSVQLTLAVLEAVACASEELGVTQIAQRVKVTKGTVYRHLLTLVECGYLNQNPQTSRYAIGPKLRLFARQVPELDLMRAAEGPMRHLRDSLGHSVVLSEMAPNAALVTRTIAGTSSIEIGVRPGSELAFHASAQGKVMLAFAPASLQQRVLKGAMKKFTAKTNVSSAALSKELGVIARRGYSMAPEETLLGINTIAAPVFDQGGRCIGAVAAVGSIQFIPDRPSRITIEAVRSCGREISRRLGHDGANGRAPACDRSSSRSSWSGRRTPGPADRRAHRPR